MNNHEKNTYVRTQITKTILEMMETEDFDKIVIGTLVKNAGIARASFYRNYDSKEAIIEEYLRSLFETWKRNVEASNEENSAMVFGRLFEHIKENQDFYLLLHRHHLSHLLLNYILEDCGPRPEYQAAIAYKYAFFAYGLFGWIEEWINRGMIEDADKIAAMFAKNQQNNG